jgi:branched-chain amino acid transport system permease protein
MAASYSVIHATRTSHIGLALLAIVSVILLSVPLWAERADMRLIVEIAYFLALAQMWNLLAGYAGLVSIGQQAWVGIGGYALFALAILGGVPLLLALPLAGLVAALVAVPTALVVFRLRGAYFAIGTWVVAEVFRLSLAQVTALGGGTGQSLPAAVVRAMADSRETREMLVYYVGLAIGFGATALVFALLRSRHGLALMALRDAEGAAESLGVPGWRTRLWVYVLAAFGTGAVGALIFLQKLRISPDAAFSVGDWTANVIFIVVIGGIGRIEGPIVGTLVFFGLRALLADYGAWYMIVLGAIAIVVMLKAPQGLWGLAASRWDLDFFPVRRRVHSASTAGR